MSNEILKKICSGLPMNPLPSLKTSRNASIPHAPDRKPLLTNEERKVIHLVFFLIPFKNYSIL